MHFVIGVPCSQNDHSSIVVSHGFYTISGANGAPSTFRKWHAMGREDIHALCERIVMPGARRVTGL